MRNQQYRMLYDILERNSISLDPEWKRHGTKGLPHLLEEIEREESYLVPHPLRRVAHVVRVVIRNQGKVLKECARKLAGKSWQTLPYPLLPSEKMYLGETYVDAATRCLKEELQIPREHVTVFQNTHDLSLELKESTSYPGLPTEYHIHTVEAGIEEWEGLLTDFLETSEEDSKRIEAHRWKWTGVADEDIWFDVRTGRIVLTLEPGGSISDSQLISIDGEVFEPSLEREVVITGRFLSDSLRDRLRSEPLHEIVVREALGELRQSEVSFGQYFLLNTKARRAGDSTPVENAKSVVQAVSLERSMEFYSKVFPETPSEYRQPQLFITHFTQETPAIQADIPETRAEFLQSRLREISPEEWNSVTGIEALGIMLSSRMVGES